MSSKRSNKKKNHKKANRRSAHFKAVAATKSPVTTKKIEPDVLSAPSQSFNQTDHSVSGQSHNMIISISIDRVEADPYQPRKFFAVNSLEQLKQSIFSTTLLDPILIRENDSKPGHYLIVDGERRWRSCKELNLDKIDCRILSKDSLDYALVSFSQNVHREDFTAMEKAMAIENIFVKMKSEDDTADLTALIAKIHLSKSYVSELLKISKLEPEIKAEALKSNLWSYPKLLRLAKTATPETRMDKFLEFKNLIETKHNKPAQKNKAVKENEPDIQEGYVKPGSLDNDPKTQTIIRKIERFKVHAKSFRSKLEGLKKLNAHPNTFDGVKTDLTQIVSLIKTILK
ncbi:MAG: ParB/RepB/Spo0J family partition protein [Deltaproteobacteria bacterium]|nr:ParB/RepB/Spo0J family partition protein [Deltaproteobacteria bacterium]